DHVRDGRGAGAHHVDPDGRSQPVSSSPTGPASADGARDGVERIVVGMSGGVDSSVAAALLVERGHEVVGVTLRVWPWEESAEATSRFGSCCGTEAVDD